MIIVGIDPGFSGAIATISINGKRPNAFLMPVMVLQDKKKTKKILDEAKIIAFLEKRKNKIAHVFIEKVQAMTKPGGKPCPKCKKVPNTQGVVSMFRFGEGFGILQGICSGLKLPKTLVAPQTWKKTICRDVPSGKGAGIIVAKRLWPDVNLLPTPRCRKDSDGMADALCIAEYGRRLLK